MNREAAVNVADELKKFREERLAVSGKALSMADAAKSLGYRNASSYQEYENAARWENKQFSDRLIARLMKNWQGKGNPPIDSAEILRLGSLYQIVINEYAEPVLLSGLRGKSLSNEAPLITAQQVEMFAKQAFKPTNTGAPPLSGDGMSNDGDRVSGDAFRLVVTDSSMAPTFNQGDEILCDPSAEIHPGNYVIAKLDSEAAATIRQYRVKGYTANKEPIVELVPVNPSYPAETITDENPGKIYARVMQRRHPV